MSIEFALDVPVVGGEVLPSGTFLVMDSGNLLTLNGELLDMEQP